MITRIHPAIAALSLIAGICGTSLSCWAESNALPSARVSPTQTELSLDDCYRLAVKRSDSLAAATQDVRAAEARYQQSLAAILPQIHFLTNQRYRNDDFQSRSSSGGSSGSADTVSSNRSGSNHPFTTSFSIQQPIFSGFREELLAEAVKSEIQSASYDRQRNVELLYFDVAESFHQARLYQRDLEILKKTEELLGRRVSELRHFIDLGKSRESEILSARSDIADLQATTEQTKGLERATLEVLAFLTGVPANDIRLASANDDDSAEPLDTYLVLAQNRSDLLAAHKRRDSLEHQEKAAERASWPSVSVEGNYYPYSDPSDSEDWDVFLKLDVPLYEGGALTARADELRANLLSSSLSSSELRRRIEKDVRVAFEQYQSAKNQLKTLRLLTDTARKNYESQRKDYELGVVTNLEVLQSIRQVQDAERRMLSTRASSQIELARLKVAAGGFQ